jgi:GxxExxY protein
MSEQRDPQTFQIIGAAMQVHRELGPGFLEKVYQEAMERELLERAVPHQHERPMPILYRGQPLKTRYFADFFCFDRVVVELKAQRALTDVDRAQLLHYLKASQTPIGLLLNFGEPSLRYERLIRS